jgi:hypothetical protein
MPDPGEGISDCFRNAPAETRIALLDVLTTRGASDSDFDAIIAVARSEDADLRLAVLKAVHSLADETVLARVIGLLPVFHSKQEKRYIEEAFERACLRARDKAGATRTILAEWPEVEPTIRPRLVRGLHRIGGPDALEATLHALNESDAALQREALRALAGWRDPAALPHLRKVFCDDKASGRSRSAALQGFARLVGRASLSPEESLRMYAEALTVAGRLGDSAGGKQTLSGVSNLAIPAALDLVEPYLQDERLQHEAAAAVVRIAGGLADTAPARALAALKRAAHLIEHKRLQQDADTARRALEKALAEQP